jgi:predicted SprT family Zn-dependent metalloprotease
MDQPISDPPPGEPAREAEESSDSCLSSARNASLDAALSALIVVWLGAWRVPELADRISLSYSRRLRRSLGRCQPERAEIRLASWLVAAPREILEEVVCHELAHAANWTLHGAKVRPHGPEWRALMSSAGFEPRARLPGEALPASLRVHTQPRLPFLHRCPNCNATRQGRLARPDWRCAGCMRAGRGGRLIIERSLPPDSGYSMSPVSR